ncbi:MAG: RIP metalloprotease RseP [Spirochaetes bacterium GWF1_49_6]|nr:MAG: RIP metalloprotease RseP [Spirochaetes bacterium GWF1_49_6]
MDILGILIAILVLGILVTVHEFGHFLMAKISGIGVDVFSIGFGKELVSWKWGETKYRIALIPLGGYCKMRGDETKDRNPKDAKDAPAEKEETPVPVEKDPKAMYNRPPWARVLAVVGGSLFNYLFAILIFFSLFLFGYKDNVVTPKVTVAEMMEENVQSPAYAAGLRTGDWIVSVNGKQAESFSDLGQSVLLGAGDKLTMVYVRDGATNTADVTPILSKKTGAGYIGISPFELPIEPVIGGLVKNRPAADAGLKEDDRILAADGKPIATYAELTNFIYANPNKIVVFQIQRGDKTFDATLQLSSVVTTNNGVVTESGLMGIYPLVKYETMEKEIRANNIFHAFALGFMEANTSLVRTWEGLVVMIKGKIDVQKHMSGPLRIIQVTGAMATHASFVKFLQFMAMIAVALAFFNILPLPGLDGGHFLLNLFEWVTRIKPSEKVLTVIEYVGLFFIISLAAIVFINDIVNIIRDAVA